MINSKKNNSIFIEDNQVIDNSCINQYKILEYFLIL